MAETGSVIAIAGEEDVCDADNESSDAEEEEDDVKEESGIADHASGWANVMSKILGKHNLTVPILAKGKKDSEKKSKKLIKDSVEVVKEEKGKRTRVAVEGSDESEDDEKKGLHDKQKRLKKLLWNEMARIKPDVVTDREKERRLQRVATKGVVQLFNAVRKQQNLVEEKLKQVGSSENKREKVMKSLSKGDFLDMLKGGKSNLSEKTSSLKNTSADTEESEKPAWNVLRDDFMMGAKMKDWDKEDSASEHDEGENMDSDSG